MSNEAVIVIVAPVGLSVPEGIHNPLSPEEIADEAAECAEAGAGMVHLHVRDTTGALTADTTEYSRTLDLIRQRSDIIVQGSTGGVSDLSLEDRCAATNDPRTEVASLNMGSANFDEGVYINTLPDIRYWARRMYETRTVPELEIFEFGMINNVRLLQEEGVIREPLNFTFCPGFRGAFPAYAPAVGFFRSLLPPGAHWGVSHHAMPDLSILGTALGLGAHFVRVGFEDGIFLEAEGRPARNVDLVKALVSLVRQMGRRVATPAEARQMLGIPPLA